jgi:hypothetical protein
MKSERRHELEANSLALWLRWRAPELLEKYGTKILLGVVIVALGVVLIRYRINAPKQAAANASDYLSLAREFVTGLENLQRTPGDAAAQVTRLIQQAVDESDDPAIQSRAHLTLGDYYWALACYPSLPEAATRPAFRPELPRNELLTKAHEAYTKALAVPDEQNYLKVRALISLGVVAEGRARDSEGNSTPQAAEQWKVAREQYEKVLALPNAPQALKDEAQWHIDELARVQQPVFLVAATQPTTAQSTTAPGTTLPSTQIVIQPIMTPATVPATQPATKPNP